MFGGDSLAPHPTHIEHVSVEIGDSQVPFGLVNLCCESLGGNGEQGLEVHSNPNRMKKRP